MKTPNTRWRRAAAAAALLLGAAGAAQAQFHELLKRVLPALPAASAPTDAVPAFNAAPSNAPRGAEPAALAGAGPVTARAGVAAELAPDRQCRRPQERFNVGEKIVEYGGTAAALRLQRLVESDFRYDDLTPQDREMLRYLAQTTVWVPPQVETRLGDVWRRLADRGDSTVAPLDAEALKEVDARLDGLRATVPDFPAQVRLVLNPALPDGAFARFGGVIELSPVFLQAMTESPAGSDLVLAHELSHVYKRHAVKQMQYELLSTSKGWELGRKLLQRALRGASFDPVADGLFVVTTLPQLIDFVRGLQAHHTREQELEADACATVWLQAAGRDPALAWREFERSAAASTSSGGGGYFGAHPPFAERADNYRRKVAAAAPAAAPPAPGRAARPAAAR